MTEILVNSEAALNQAIATVDGATSGSYTITFAANIVEGTDGGDLITYKSQTLLAPDDLYALNLVSGVSVTINGAGYSLSGANTYRGLIVYAGNVTISYLTISDSKAQGGDGGSGSGGGGGGAGLGGGLLVASGATVTLSGVTFTRDSAIGGGTGLNLSAGDGGGGGLGGDGGDGVPSDGGGGGVGSAASGGTSGNADGGMGVVLGANSGGSNGHGDAGGSFGGGGAAGAGGGVNGLPNGAGGWGGGGARGGNGGFGGGGAAGGGDGGFGGGGGSDSTEGTPGRGGFGGGDGSNGGGGGLGAGGDVFVQAGGTLLIEGGSLGGGTVTGGTGLNGGADGEALGSSIFIQGNQSITLAPLNGRPLVVTGSIADQNGSSGGRGGVIVTASTGGGGVVVLAGTSSYSGGTAIDTDATLELDAANAAGTGTITFNGTPATLQLDAPALAGGSLANVVAGFAVGDTLDLRGLRYVSGATAVVTNGTLAVSSGGITDTIVMDGAIGGAAFTAASDGAGGTAVTGDPNLILVSNEVELNQAIARVDSATAGSYTIRFTSSIYENTEPVGAAPDLYALHLGAGVTVTIDGANHTLDGANAYRGLLVYAGSVKIQDLTIADAVARGGDGAVGSGGGGGGAGLGGGLLVARGATVTLTSVSFTNDSAVGGMAATLPHGAVAGVAA